MAASDKVIAASLKLDTGDASKELKTVNTGINEVKTSAKSAGETVQGTTGHFSKLKEQLNGMPGPLGTANAGVNTLSKSFKALLANPVALVLVAIVGALTLLWKAFSTSYEGAKKLEQVFAGLKAAGQSLLDNLDKIGSAIVKVFSFDFSGAVADIKSVATAAGQAYSTISNLVKQSQDLAKEQRQNDLEGAQRAKQLALLREQATDETVPIAKRKAALKELKADAEKNAKDDIDLARRVAENKIAQLTVEKDGALKNADEINKIKIEQINGETENANELRRINKQLTATEKQEQQERTEAAKAAAEKKKEQLQQLAEFNLQLLKIQQDNELSIITDGYEKELKVLDFKISAEKAANIKALEDKKITQAQYDQLTIAQEQNAAIQRQAITDKHNEDVKKKETEFQVDLAKVRQDTMLKGITDSRELEKVQLTIQYEEKLQAAKDRYKDDQTKFFEYKNALDEQLKQDQAALDEKNRVEDGKKKLDAVIESDTEIINDPEVAYDKKKAVLDAEQQAIDEAYAAGIISMEEYTKATDDNEKARQEIRDREAEHQRQQVSAIADALGTLSELAGKQTVAGKALAIASSTIKSIQAGISTFTGFTTQFPGPVGLALGAVAAAGVVAAQIANVKKIIGVKVPNASDSGASAAGSGGFTAPPAPLAPSQQGTKIDQSTIERLADANKLKQEPQRSYVLSGDIQSAADREARLERAARLGG